MEIKGCEMVILGVKENDRLTGSPHGSNRRMVPAILSFPRIGKVLADGSSVLSKVVGGLEHVQDFPGREESRVLEGL